MHFKLSYPEFFAEGERRGKRLLKFIDANGLFDLFGVFAERYFKLLLNFSYAYPSLALSMLSFWGLLYSKLKKKAIRDFSLHASSASAHSQSSSTGAHPFLPQLFYSRKGINSLLQSCFFALKRVVQLHIAEVSLVREHVNVLCALVCENVNPVRDVSFWFSRSREEVLDEPSEAFFFAGNALFWVGLSALESAGATDLQAVGMRALHTICSNKVFLRVLINTPHFSEAFFSYSVRRVGEGEFLGGRPTPTTTALLRVLFSSLARKP